MTSFLTRTIGTVALAATSLSLTLSPALADPPPHAKAHGYYKKEGHHKYDKHYDRNVRIVHVYDYDRPDPRYHGYYANRYYSRGYEPIRVTRSTRIYRGSDDRYYCRRSDGTTGLIVGAALGGFLGSRIDRGSSSVVGTIIGAGAGALIGREIDRGGIVCR